MIDLMHLMKSGAIGFEEIGDAAAVALDVGHPLRQTRLYLLSVSFICCFVFDAFDAFDIASVVGAIRATTNEEFA